MSSSVTSKFKKGDKVSTALGEFEVLWFGVDGYTGREIYVCYQKGFRGHSALCTLGSDCYENTIYQGQCWCFKEGELEFLKQSEACKQPVVKNYREMKPTDLITISIDGKETEVPLGDLVHATALLGVSNGYYGLRLWEALYKSLGKDGFVTDDTIIEFRDKQKEALDYFFKPYYDKQHQEKSELVNLIASKQKEVDLLREKLGEIYD